MFGRVARILEDARGQVVRVVNHAMVSAYWQIGREIVEALQRGDERAAYGKALIERLARQLTDCYGKGFSVTNLGYCRQFYLAYRDRIPHPLGGELPPNGVPSAPAPAAGPEAMAVFHPNLTWSHYRTLMRVADKDARRFHEIEAVRANWSRRDLERQISSLYHERLLVSTDEVGLLGGGSQPTPALRPVDVLKDPYVLEFLDLPTTPQLSESQLEHAIITRLQEFLLELGRGFSFMARQQRVRFADRDFYIDLVFYNCLLKCFVLVDLKIGELTHQDIGQMDGYREERSYRSLFGPSRQPAAVRFALSLHVTQRGGVAKRATARTRFDRKQNKDRSATIAPARGEKDSTSHEGHSGAPQKATPAAEPLSPYPQSAQT
jgi:predicted nuclease of restriction endonuclease-like (RecB) superfamily